VISHRTNLSNPIAAFLAIVEATALLPKECQPWALFLLTTPIPPHLLDWADVHVDKHGERTVVYTVSDSGEKTTRRLRLSATAETILRPGAGPVLELLGLSSSLSGATLVNALALALEESCGSDSLSLTRLHAVATCVARMMATGATDVTVDGLVARCGFAVP
jgi:hypothetical protein